MKNINYLKPLTVILVIIAFNSCTNRTNDIKHSDDSLSLKSDTSNEITNLMKEFKVTGVGIGVIQNGTLTTTAYYGEQSQDIPVTKHTMFNVASVTKAITAEVFLRLASKGEVHLDEPISDYYVFADIVDDPRHKLLTPRIILSHQTGFKNWPYEYEDGKLAFENTPGTKFGYSGIGFYILAKFLEEKMATTFPHLVDETIFKPLHMKNSSIVIEAWFKKNSPTPVNTEGAYMKPYERTIGYWNPADDLHITVEDYSKFLISAMNNDGLTKEMIFEREKIITSLTKDAIWGTDESEHPELFPPAYGYGLGWMIFDYGNGNKNIQHGGNDRGEAAMGYFHTKTKNGLIVFVNGGNGAFLLPKLVEVLDTEQKYTPVYNYIFDKFY